MQYEAIRYGNVAVCFFVGLTEILPAKHIMKTDEDAFVRIVVTHRDKDNNWYISTEEWPPASYPLWAHGPGYVASKDIERFIVQGHRK